MKLVQFIRERKAPRSTDKQSSKSMSCSEATNGVIVMDKVLLLLGCAAEKQRVSGNDTFKRGCKK